VTWRDDGQPSAVETGTVEGTSDSDWAAMNPLEGAIVAYDSHNRPTVRRLVSAATTYALSQTGYDPRGRVRCTAQRMNPDEFASSSLPADACALDTEGSYGPDRIARASYDAGRPAAEDRLAIQSSIFRSSTVSGKAPDISTWA